MSIFGKAELTDAYGFDVENTPMGEQRVITPFRLAGATFDLSGNAGAVDTNFWTPTVSGAGGTDGTVVQSNASVELSSGTGAATFSRLNSVRRARYIAGYSNRYRANIRLGDTGTANNKREWGTAYGSSMPTITDGAFFRLSGTTLQVVTVKAGVETVVSSGAFNGVLGLTYAPNLDSTTYEIYWTNNTVYFVIDDKILHKVSSLLTTWSATMSLHVWFNNVNTAAQGSALILNSRNAAIHRLGPGASAPQFKNIHGTNAGVVLKYGPGKLKLVNINAQVSATTVSLYDALSATNPIALIGGTGGAGYTQIYELDFFTGLFVVTVNAATDVTITYE